MANGGKSGFERKEMSLSDSVNAYYHPVVLCLHTDNLAINEHGLGITLYVRENLYSEEDPVCEDCRFKCTQKSMQCVTKEHCMPSKLMRRRVKEGFSFKPDEIKTIQSNAGLKRFAFDIDRAAAIEIC